jgi:hypothetical protein
LRLAVITCTIEAPELGVCRISRHRLNRSVMLNSSCDNPIYRYLGKVVHPYAIFFHVSSSRDNSLQLLFSACHATELHLVFSRNRPMNHLRNMLPGFILLFCLAALSLRNPKAYRSATLAQDHRWLTIYSRRRILETSKYVPLFQRT